MHPDHEERVACETEAELVARSIAAPRGIVRLGVEIVKRLQLIPEFCLGQFFRLCIGFIEYRDEGREVRYRPRAFRHKFPQVMRETCARTRASHSTINAEAIVAGV